MLPLALFLREGGARVAGSDRGRDQGVSPEKFALLEQRGIKLFPQDGSGVGADVTCLVVSSAVEDHIPDVAAARAQQIPVRKRAEILAGLFNMRRGIGIAGTSGKTTVTGMAARIFDLAGYDPAVVNGGVMVDFADEQGGNPGNYKIGRGDYFIAEMDESDGSVTLFTPEIAVLNNITLDHKPIAELRPLFTDFLRRARVGAVVNLDDAEAAALAEIHPHTLLFSTVDAHKDRADVYAGDIEMRMDGSQFTLHYQGRARAVFLPVPGRHNIANALAAIAAAIMAGVDFDVAAAALEKFSGIRRRLDVLGKAGGISVIDDFAHNPDKIAASLSTLRHIASQAGGRLIVMFQPHGFGPMIMMRDQIADAFADGLGPDDMVLMPEIYYAGGTAAQALSSSDMVADMVARGATAHFLPTRAEIRDFILQHARPGDCVVIMGARDDTLPVFGRALLNDFAAMERKEGASA